MQLSYEDQLHVWLLLLRNKLAGKIAPAHPRDHRPTEYALLVPERSPWARSMPCWTRRSRSSTLQRSSGASAISLHLMRPFPRTDGGPTSASGCSASGVDKNGKPGPLLWTRRILSTARFDSIEEFRAIFGDLWSSKPPKSDSSKLSVEEPGESMKLPTDPQGRNDERAHWAQVTLAAFVAETGTDESTALVEFLVGVMHWCDRSGESFEAHLERAILVQRRDKRSRDTGRRMLAERQRWGMR